MRSLFRNETDMGRMELFKQSSFFSVEESRMSSRHGEGEEEIGNHGGSSANSFSQETEAKGQQGKTRKVFPRPTLKRFKCRMHADTLTQLPFFLNLNNHQDRKSHV